ncbi:DUF1853 family protein [Marinobacter salinexigens]|uniref:DUF1853 family protein n=1 Tax=Marinobacter salinexigens TaxID=2919747 RepID=A0A5B0V977_9GAMM|nr:DUF1853 family protein [Marinobacter salinexigens]KAA1171127.1 DUF1853 family protein [Marinobacter salinexigens]
MELSDKNRNLMAFHTPVIRHLAWLCDAPQLINSELSFRPLDYLPANYRETLLDWDQNPQHAPASLLEPPPRRLGFYFEHLYNVLLTDLLGWKVLLKNIQIQAAGKTLGELDFVVHNTSDDRIEHHEIAIKYYLGVSERDMPPLWYGPNARDRLDLKSDRLLHHQSQRTREPQTRALLQSHRIDSPLTARVFMPGYLFYPLNPVLSSPSGCPENHLRGRWTYASDTKEIDTSHWVQLLKPHWIGPWLQQHLPLSDAADNALGKIEQDQIPRLFAQLAFSERFHQWCEVERYFIVPSCWPDKR